jgi:hypothetical protein
VRLGTADRAGLVGVAAADTRDALDDYVEAHVHGGVRLASDVEALVVDPSFRGTAVEETARRLPCALEWHPGFVLRIEDVRRRPDFKTPEAVALAERVAVDGLLTAAILGAAAPGRDPQTVKYVWHYIARFGRPAVATADAETNANDFSCQLSGLPCPVFLDFQNVHLTGHRLYGGDPGRAARAAARCTTLPCL